MGRLASSTLNARARELRDSGGVEWLHFTMGVDVPPVDRGSYNHLLWQLLARRKSDAVVSSFREESWETAQDAGAAVIQTTIEDRSISYRIKGAGHRAASRLIKGTMSIAVHAYLSEFARIAGEMGAKNIAVWDLIRPIRRLRHLLPDANILFAQRHYDYPTEDAYYSDCDIVVMQTRGQLRRAFEQVIHMTPLPFVIANGAETDLFRPATEEERVSERRRHGLPEDAFVALFPSKLAVHKGTRYLLHWIRRAVREEAPIHFLAVGGKHPTLKEPHRKELIDTLRGGGNVTWLEGISRRDMPAIYRTADVCLMPAAWREGFSLAAVEAMASGLTVIAPSLACYEEMVTDGETGVVVPLTKMREAGYEAILELSEDRDRVRRIGATAREYALATCDRSRQLDEFDAVLTENLIRG